MKFQVTSPNCTSVSSVFAHGAILLQAMMFVCGIISPPPVCCGQLHTSARVAHQIESCWRAISHGCIARPDYRPPPSPVRLVLEAAESTGNLYRDGRLSTPWYRNGYAEESACTRRFRSPSVVGTIRKTLRNLALIEWVISSSIGYPFFSSPHFSVAPGSASL